MAEVLRRARREVEIRRLSKRVTLLADELLLSMESLDVSGAGSAIVEIVPTEVKLLKAKTAKALDQFQDGIVQFFESSVIIAISNEDFEQLKKAGLLNNVDYEILTELNLDQAIEKFNDVAIAISNRRDRIEEMKAFLTNPAVISKYKVPFAGVADSTKSDATNRRLATLYNELYGDFAKVLQINPSEVAWDIYKSGFFFKMNKGLDRLSYLNYSIAKDFKLALNIVVVEEVFLTELSRLVDSLADAMFA